MKRSVAIIGLALVCVVSFFGLNELNTPKPFDTDSIPDVIEHLTGIAADAVVATVDGEPILAEDYLYWVGYTAEMEEYYLGSDIDWDLEVDGVTEREFVAQSSLETAKLYRIVETEALKAGCDLDEEDQAAVDKAYTNMVTQAGGEEAMDKWLMQIGLTTDGYLRINRISYLYDNLLQSLIDDSPATEEEVEEYIRVNDVLVAKHILLSTVDSATNQALSEDEIARKKQTAEDILKQLEESDDPLSLYDQLMVQYSEDPGLTYYPDGYTFTANEMVAEFEQGTRDLEYNEISGIIESPYGYHIILRLDPATEEYAEKVGRIQGQSEGQLALDTLLSNELAEAELVTTEAYEQLDVAAYYDGLKALRDEINAQDAAARNHS